MLPCHSEPRAIAVCSGRMVLWSTYCLGGLSAGSGDRSTGTLRRVSLRCVGTSRRMKSMQTAARTSRCMSKVRPTVESVPTDGPECAGRCAPPSASAVLCSGPSLSRGSPTSACAHTHAPPPLGRACVARVLLRVCAPFCGASACARARVCVYTRDGGSRDAAFRWSQARNTSWRTTTLSSRLSTSASTWGTRYGRGCAPMRAHSNAPAHACMHLQRHPHGRAHMRATRARARTHADRRIARAPPRGSPQRPAATALADPEGAQAWRYGCRSSGWGRCTTEFWGRSRARTSAAQWRRRRTRCLHSMRWRRRAHGCATWACDRSVTMRCLVLPIRLSVCIDAGGECELCVCPRGRRSGEH